MSKPAQRPRNSGRGPEKKQPRKRFLIVCEGEVTELEYFTFFKNWVTNPLVDVIPLQSSKGTHACGVVQAALEKRKELEGENRWQAHDELWCVYDVDAKPSADLNNARQRANANNVNVAVSNPSFELWLLLHLREPPGMQRRDQVAAMLTKLLDPPKYEKHLDDKHWEKLWPGYGDAVKRSQRLRADPDFEGKIVEQKNPSTDVDLLTESIREAREAPAWLREP